LSCTAFYSQFFRCYSPIAFPKKTDKHGDFVRRYCPELEKYDTKYIYEPWKAPIQDQKKAGCLIKGDGTSTSEGEYKAYPKPMFDFAERREICIRSINNAYAVGLYGDNPKVKDGTWRELFTDDAEGPTQGKRGPMGAMVEGAVQHEDATGEEEHDEHMAQQDHGHNITKSPPTPKGLAGSKRKGQGTLDGMVKRMKK